MVNVKKKDILTFDKIGSVTAEILMIKLVPKSLMKTRLISIVSKPIKVLVMVVVIAVVVVKKKC